jgi:hypothetical protein
MVKSEFSGAKVLDIFLSLRKEFGYPEIWLVPWLLIAAQVGRNTAAATTGKLILVAGMEVQLHCGGAKCPRDYAQGKFRDCRLPLCYCFTRLPVL